MANLADKIIEYAETLVLVGGDCNDQQFTCLPWEKKFIRGAFNNPGPAALSIARGNGKTALVAVLACAVVDPAGPLHGNRKEVLAIAAAFAQATIVFSDVLAMLGRKYNLADRKVWRVRDSANEATIRHVASGSMMRAMGGNPALVHGRRPALALLDEPAKWQPARSAKMYAAVKTGLGKMPNSKLIALGTHPVDSDHWFSKLLASASYSQVHAARPTDPLYQTRTIRRANPSYDLLPSLRKELAEEAGEARLDESARAEWEAYRLNKGVMDTVESLLMDATTWADAEKKDTAQSGPYALGVDPGTTAAMSACAAFWPNTGRLDCFAVFPAVPSLLDRGRADGVTDLYARMHRQGGLVIAGERVSDLAAMLREARARWGDPAAVVSDRWREGELREALNAAGVPPCAFTLRGQGFKDGAEDVRMFRRSVFSGRCRPVPSLLLRTAMSEARTAIDASGNQKLAKSTQGGRRARARDDAAAAAILAVAEGERRVGGGKPSNVVELRRVA